MLDAELRPALAAMRALGRAGRRVGAVVCASQAWWAPSLQSRYCAAGAVVPELSASAPAYAQAILDVLDEHPTRLLAPMSDGSIHTLRPRRAELERRCALSLASEAALDIAASKSHTLALGRTLGLRVPRGVPVNAASDLPAALRETGLPVVIKPAEGWVVSEGVGRRLPVTVAASELEAQQTLQGLMAVGGHALLQEWLPGRREAVSQFYAHGRFWARMAQRSYREWPALGGTATLCETIPLPEDIGEAAARLVQAMDLEGCSMVEFRRDRQGRPVLMEVNPRMGASAALAISAGVNLPELMTRWKLGEPLVEHLAYPAGRRLRWLAGDVRNLKYVWANQGRPDVPPRLAAAARFAADFLRPHTAYGLEPSDPRPMLSKLEKFLGRPSAGRKLLAA